MPEPTYVYLIHAAYGDGDPYPVFSTLEGAIKYAEASTSHGDYIYRVTVDDETSLYLRNDLIVWQRP